MARLNELPVPADNHLEILRRKFLRQNRDIAKINSDQSQKIRRLENDCARLLSENLELRSQILRLEKQVQDNAARRIADHALEVKAKLEMQLSEFASLLGSLGMEPPSKRRSSEERILARSRPSMVRSPPQRRRRDTMDAEALADQEGRLPPIYENKTYPRATMNSEEILALCAAAEDTTDSPALGPPPVSRFVEDMAQHSSPPRITDDQVIPESPRLPQPSQSPPRLDYDRGSPERPEPRRVLEEISAKEAAMRKHPSSTRHSAPTPPSQPVRAGAKRKYGDENGNSQGNAPGTGKENTTISGTVDKSFPTRGGQKRRSIKELSGARGGRIGTSRTPLAAKSTNEDISSPRKPLKPVTAEAVKKEQTRGTRDRPTEEASAEVSLPKIELPPPEVPAAITVMLEQATALPSATSGPPSTPDRPPRTEMPHDTPPPADISSNGETSRPSRRARAAISYAEPNLRDKMRRPTKELLDAVSGEGKYVHRTASKLDDHHSAPASATKAGSEAGSLTGRSSKTVPTSEQVSKTQQHVILSPLAQKDIFQETLPNTVVMERRRRPSAVGSGSRESLAAVERPDLSPAAPEKISRNQPIHHSPPPAPKPKPDIYDFTNSSPSAPSSTSSSSTKPPPPATSSSSSTSTSIHTTEPPTATTNPRARTARKSSMAAAAALRELLDEEEQDTKFSSKPHRAPRKRASMLAPKKTSMLLVDEEEEGVGEVGNSSGLSGVSEGTEGSSFGEDRIEEGGRGGGGGGGVGGLRGGGGRGTAGGRDRISRRRSMML